MTKTLFQQVCFTPNLVSPMEQIYNGKACSVSSRAIPRAALHATARAATARLQASTPGCFLPYQAYPPTWLVYFLSNQAGASRLVLPHQASASRMVSALLMVNAPPSSRLSTLTTESSTSMAYLRLRMPRPCVQP